MAGSWRGHVLSVVCPSLPEPSSTPKATGVEEVRAELDIFVAGRNRNNVLSAFGRLLQILPVVWRLPVKVTTLVVFGPHDAQPRPLESLERVCGEVGDGLRGEDDMVVQGTPGPLAELALN